VYTSLLWVGCEEVSVVAGLSDGVTADRTELTADFMEDIGLAELVGAGLLPLDLDEMRLRERRKLLSGD
jgi:hypothetical protein